MIYIEIMGGLGNQLFQIFTGISYSIDNKTPFKIKFNKKSSLEISGSITNIYNRENIFYFNRIKNERINQLPFMPSLGINFLF